ncbi:MAG: spore cortex biosynthesis protein YabQ [Thermotaleaceae bacterium]
MSPFILEQIYIFLATTYGGIIIGFIYDLYRIFRNLFHPKKITTMIQDIFFWMVIAVVAIWVLIFSASGQLRFYSFLGFALGVLLYHWSFSSFIIHFTMKMAKLLYRMGSRVIRVLLYPLNSMRNKIRLITAAVYLKIRPLYIKARGIGRIPKKKIEKIKKNLRSFLKKK